MSEFRPKRLSVTYPLSKTHWSCFLNRMPQGVRKELVSDRHFRVASLPVRLGRLLRFNIRAALSMAGADVCEGERSCFGSIRRSGSSLILLYDLSYLASRHPGRCHKPH